MATNWKQRLAKIKDFEAAKGSAEQMGGSVPDAQYHTKLTSVELAESQASGREQINMFMEILEGEFAGHTISSFPGLDEEQSLPFTIAMLRNLGYEINETDDIVDAVESLATELPELIVRVKKGFCNVLSRADSVQEDNIGGDQAQVEEDVEEAASAEIAVGSEVIFDWKGEQLEGVVKAFADGYTKVSCNGKTYPVKPENVELKSAEPEPEPETEPEVEEESEVEPEEVKPKVIKKTAAKPAPKKVIKKKR